MNARVSLVPAENKREHREDVTDNNIDDPIGRFLPWLQICIQIFASRDRKSRWRNDQEFRFSVENIRETKK